MMSYACGNNHTIYIEHDGRVYGIGDNTFKQLGMSGERYDVPTLISELENIIQISCGQHHSMFLAIDGTVYRCGVQMGLIDITPIPTVVELEDRIVQMAHGNDHILLLSADGHVYGLGSNLDFQMGGLDPIAYQIPTLIPGIENVVEIVCSSYSSTLYHIDGMITRYGSFSQLLK
jgi:alpha-tubulin suppressor-like RCC1 family protein